MKNIKFVLVFALPIFLVLLSCEKEADSDPTETERSIERVEVEYFYDNVTYRYRYKDGSPTEYVRNLEHGAEITSVAGTTESNSRGFDTFFDNPPVLGKTTSGYMEGFFTSGHQNLTIYISQRREFNSIIFGDVIQTFSFRREGIPFNKSYTDDFTDLMISEYYLGGTRACINASVSFGEDNNQYNAETTTVNCGTRAYIKVKVYWKA